MSAILFSYRPTDSKPIAERILERLKYNYSDEVRTDVRSSKNDLRSYLDDLLPRDAVLVLVIGPSWVSSRSKAGVRRLEDPQDYIRLEVEVALAKNLPVIPILVRGAKMPEAEALPEGIKALARIPPFPFGSDDEFRGDMMRLHRLLARKRVHHGTRQTSASPIDTPLSSATKDHLNALAKQRLEAGRPPFDGVTIGSLGEVLWIVGAQSSTLGSLYGARKFPPDLSGADLSNLNLSNADLSGRKFIGAKLTQANLAGANISGADLSGADLTEASLVGARLNGTLLHAAELQLANLSGCNMEGADLSDVDLTTTNLTLAVLDSANLERAILTQQDLRAARLNKANLAGANLVDAKLPGAQLEGAHLEDSRLDGADLSSARLVGADLSRAMLINTDLSSADLSDATIASIDDLRRVIVAGDPQFRKVKWGGKPIKDPRQINDRSDRLQAYREAAQIYHDLAEMLRDRGLLAEASSYRLREQKMRRGVLRTTGRFGPWFFSGLLNVISGYGERISRTLVTYLTIVLLFAAFYFVGTNSFGLEAAHLSVYEAFIQSVAAFHGRGFVSSALQLGDPMAGVTLLESVAGLFVEAIFIATFSRRFLGD